MGNGRPHAFSAPRLEMTYPLTGGKMRHVVGRMALVLLVNLFIGGTAALAQPFTAFRISNDPENSILAQTDGRFVVWQSITYPSGASTVLGYDLLTSLPVNLAAGGDTPALSNGILAKASGTGVQGQ